MGLFKKKKATGDLEKQFAKIMMSLLDIQAVASRMPRTPSIYTSKEKIDEECYRIVNSCKKIREEIKKIEILDELFKKEMDDSYRFHS